MILTFPNGQEVDVIFDEAAHSYHRRYKLADGTWTDYTPTHGITAPLSVVPKEFLKPWAAKMAAETLMESLAELNWDSEQFAQFLIDKKAMEENHRTPEDKPVMSSYRFNKQYPFFAESKRAYKNKAGASADFGTWMHSAIEHYYKSDRKQLPVFTDEYRPAWDSFIMFDNFFKPKADKDGLEFLVYSLMLGYSGQGDFRGTMSGKTVIGDWKTTNRSYQNRDGISVDYFFQLGGLAQAEYERTGKWVDDLFAANFNKEGDEPRVIWASDFGMAPQDCAKAYVGCFNTYHTIQDWDYRFKKR